MDNSTAAHRCFAIPDLTHVILGLASSGRGRADVFKYVCTCRTFSEPVLDVLWRDVDTLAPLLRLFPPRWLRSTTNVASRWFKRAPAGAEWDRFDAHAARVHALEVWDLDNEANGMSAGVFAVLATRGAWPLPHQRRLAWRAHDGALFAHARLFLPPGLVALELVLHGAEPPPPPAPALRAAFAHLVHTCLALRELLVLSPDDEEDMPEREDGAVIAECVSAFVESGPTLETLAVTGRGVRLARGTVARLTRMPRLGDLHAHVGWRALGAEDEEPAAPFPALHTIVTDFGTLAPMLRAHPAPRLEQLTVRTPAAMTPAAFAAVGAALRPSAQLTSLSLLSLSAARLGHAAFQPLLALRALRRLHVRGAHLAPDDALLARRHDRARRPCGRRPSRACARSSARAPPSARSRSRCAPPRPCPTGTTRSPASASRARPSRRWTCARFAG